tara:strand:+ start:5516 stop:6133 length:618 start_codon:yes stop_codon:yes gene_type:complete
MRNVLLVSGEMKQIEVGQAITGQELYEPVIEKAGYYHTYGKTTTFIPSAVFCPECSKLREHNPRTGKVERKRNMEEKDYCFQIVYDENGNGICANCNWKMPQPPKLDAETESLRAVGEDHTTEQEWIGEAEYDEGYFWLSQEDYQALFQVVIKAHRDKLNLAPAVFVAGSGYQLNNKSFIEVAKKKQYKEEDGRMGIPRQCWQSL